jgi:hypothetical protein
MVDWRKFKTCFGSQEAVLTQSDSFCLLQQGCQMVCFQTKNPNLGKFLRVLQWKMMVYFIDTWSIYSILLYFMDIWYILVLVACWYLEPRKNLATLSYNGCCCNADDKETFLI